MFTPTITQDKSMFKVGAGVDVDYSANVKDGAYESLVFKGKSLVNVIGKVTVSNNATDNGNGSYTINKNTAYSRINVFGGNPMIKVNTPYYFTVIVSNGTLTNLNVDTGKCPFYAMWGRICLMEAMNKISLLMSMGLYQTVPIGVQQTS